MPGFPVHHQLPELTQTHVHRAGDAMDLMPLKAECFYPQGKAKFPSYSLSLAQNHATV